MSLTKYYNTNYGTKSMGSFGTEFSDGTVVAGQYSFLGYQPGSGELSHLFKTSAVGHSGNVRVLPQTHLEFDVYDMNLFPWSGRIYCELSSSPAVVDATVSGVSSRNKTAAFFDVNDTYFKIALSDYHYNVIDYWKMDEPYGDRVNSVEGGSPLVESSGAIYSSSGIDLVRGLLPKDNQAAMFSGVSPYIQNTGINAPGETDFLLSFWCKSVEGSINTYRVLELREGGSVLFGLDCQNSGEHVIFTKEVRGTSEEITGNSLSGEWFHVGFGDYDFFQGESGLSFISINSTTLDGDQRRTLSGGYGPQNIIINPNRNGDFLIDEIALFSGLTADEMTAVMNYRINTYKTYPLLKGAVNPVKIAYAPFGPLQEVYNNHPGMDSFAFIYDHIDGSGYIDTATPELYMATTNEGEDIPDTSENNGLIAYWDFDGIYDKINNYPLFARGDTALDTLSINNSPVIYNSGLFSIAQGEVRHTSVLKNVGNSGAQHDFVYQSSVNPTGNNSYVFWGYNGTDIDESSFSINRNVDVGDVDSSSKDAVSVATNEFLSDGLANNIGIMTQLGSSFGSQTSRRGLQMHYAGFDKENSGIHYSVNGQPIQVSGFATNYSTPSGGISLKIKSYTVDELRIYDRLLDELDLQRLYNAGFPESLNKPPLKKQFMYPVSDEMPFRNQRIGYGQSVNNMESLGALWTELYNVNDYTSSYSTYSGHFFAAINDVYHYDDPHLYNRDLDLSTITTDENTDSCFWEFGFGRMQVKPSSINVHFAAKCLVDGSGKHEVHLGTFPYLDNFISGIELLDRNDVPITAVNDQSIRIGFSGKYGTTDNFIHYESSLPIAANLDDRDLSNVKLKFFTEADSLPGSSGFSRIDLLVHKVTLEVDGDVNIAQTGLGLYELGGVYANSGLDLYTTAMDSKNSGIDLYTLSYEVAASSIPLYTSSHESLSSGLDLYTLSHDIINSSVPLYTVNYETVNSGIDLYTIGHGVQNSSINLYTVSSASDFSGLDLYTNSHIQVNSGVDLYTEGSITENSNMPLFIEATVYDQSGNIPLFIWSTSESGKFSTLPLYLQVSDNSGTYSTMPLFLDGVTSETLNTTMPLFLSNSTFETKSLELFLKNAYSSGEKSLNLKIRGLGGLDGGVPLGGNMPLFMSRDSEGAERGIPLYLQTNSGENKSLNLFISGGTWENKTLNLVIPSTYELKNSGIDLQINGF